MTRHIHIGLQTLSPTDAGDGTEVFAPTPHVLDGPCWCTEDRAAARYPDELRRQPGLIRRVLARIWRAWR